MPHKWLVMILPLLYADSIAYPCLMHSEPCSIISGHFAFCGHPLLIGLWLLTHTALPPAMGCLQDEMLLDLLWDPTPGLGTGWLRADPKVQESSPGTVPSQHHLQPGLSGFWVRTQIDLFLSGLKMRAGHRSRSGPQIYHQSVHGRFLNTWGRQWRAFKEALAWNSTGEMAGTGALNHGWRGSDRPLDGLLGWRSKLKGPFCTLALDPEAKTLVFTLSSDLPAPHMSSLHCAMDLGHPNSSSCLWDAPLDSQEPFISSEMEKQFKPLTVGQ